MIEQIEKAIEIALLQFGNDSPEIVLRFAALLASREIEEELAEIVGFLLHSLEIHAK